MAQFTLAIAKEIMASCTGTRFDRTIRYRWGFYNFPTCTVLSMAGPPILVKRLIMLLSTIAYSTGIHQTSCRLRTSIHTRFFTA